MSGKPHHAVLTGLHARQDVLARQAEIIKAEREAIGLTQQEAAEAMGVSVEAVHKWEQGHRKCGATTLLRACFEGTLAGAALAQRILKQVYPSTTPR